MNTTHELLLQDAFLGLSRLSPEIPIITRTGTVQVKRDVLCFFSRFLNTLLSSVPLSLDTAIIVPDIPSKHVEHITKILKHGVTDITSEERREYIDIVEEAQEIGIMFDNISFFKQKLNKVKNELNDDKNATLNDNHLPFFSKSECAVENSTHPCVGEKEVNKSTICNEVVDIKTCEIKDAEQKKENNAQNKDVETQNVEIKNALQKEPSSDHMTETNKQIVKKDENFQDFSAENRNVHISDNSSEQVTNDSPLFCQICDKTYNTKQGLKTHIESIHDGVRYPCSQCPYRASGKGTLKKHILFTHDKIGVTCMICDTKHRSETHLKRHIAEKHEKLKVSCSQCSFQTTNKYTLAWHIKNIHTANRELYRCEICENEYVSKNALQQHIATKHEGKRYPCDACHVLFSEPKSLKLHVKTIHENIRIPCNLCETTHSSKQHLKHHIENKHEGVKYPCSQCSFKSASKYGAKQHAKNIHNR